MGWRPHRSTGCLRIREAIFGFPALPQSTAWPVGTTLPRRYRIFLERLDCPRSRTIWRETLLRTAPATFGWDSVVGSRAFVREVLAFLRRSRAARTNHSFKKWRSRREWHFYGPTRFYRKRVPRYGSVPRDQRQACRCWHAHDAFAAAADQLDALHQAQARNQQQDNQLERQQAQIKLQQHEIYGLKKLVCLDHPKAEICEQATKP